MSKDIYRFLLCLFMAMSCAAVQGQADWRNLGPDNIGNTTRSIVYFNGGANILAGSQGGGLWRSIDDGESWEAVTSYVESAAGIGGSPHITDIAVDGNTIYVSTGSAQFQRPATGLPSEYQTRRDGFIGNLAGKPGAGVFVSTDNGESWGDTLNATNPASGNFHTGGPFADVMTVAARDGLVLIGTSEGLYVSNDQLGEVALAEGPAFLQENLIFDIEFAGAPGNEQVLVIAHFDDAATPEARLFTAPLNGSALPTFTEIVEEPISGPGGILSASGIERSEIAVAPSNPDIMYLASANPAGIQAVYRHALSQPGEWTRVGPRSSSDFAPLGSNARSSFVLKVFPDNENELIAAGSLWYTFSEETNWLQTASHFTPFFSDYLPTPIYEVAFDPNDPNHFFVGTTGAIRATFDRGITFSARTRGYEASLAVSVSSVGETFDATNDDDDFVSDVVMSGTNSAGAIYNANYNRTQASSQSYGVMSTRNNTRVAGSILYPGNLIIQGADGGLERSTTRGDIFEPFYGLPRVPGVKGLMSSDTLINASAGFEEESETDSTIVTGDTSFTYLGSDITLQDSISIVDGDTVAVGDTTVLMSVTDILVSPNNDSTFIDTIVNIIAGSADIVITRLTRVRNISIQGSLIAALRPSTPQSVWLLDEYVPPSLLDSIEADTPYTQDDLRERIPSYIFYCSKEYLWLVTGAFNNQSNDPAQWNRLTPSLVDGVDERFTAITVSNDGNHTVYLGTSKGNIWRIDRAHDIDNFDPAVNIKHITESVDAVNLTPMRNRWITDIAVDPLSPDRIAVAFAGYGEFSVANQVLGGLYLTDDVTVDSALFAPIISTTELPTGVPFIPQCYSVAFVLDGERTTSTLMVGTERGLFSFGELPEVTVPPQRFASRYVVDNVTLELNVGNAPVYDIYQRPLVSTILQDAVVREVEIELPGGGTETREQEFDRMILQNDNTVYIASYGRGVWSTGSFQARRGRQDTQEEKPFASLEQGEITIGNNPASDVNQPIVYVNPQEAGNVSIRAFDMSGRVIYGNSQPIVVGLQAIPLEDWQAGSAGIYFLQVEVQEAAQTYLKTFRVIWE